MLGSHNQGSCLKLRVEIVALDVKSLKIKPPYTVAFNVCHHSYVLDMWDCTNMPPKLDICCTTDLETSVTSTRHRLLKPADESIYLRLVICIYCSMQPPFFPKTSQTRFKFCLRPLSLPLTMMKWNFMFQLVCADSLASNLCQSSIAILRLLDDFRFKPPFYYRLTQFPGEPGLITQGRRQL